MEPKMGGRPSHVASLPECRRMQRWTSGREINRAELRLRESTVINKKELNTRTHARTPSGLKLGKLTATSKPKTEPRVGRVAACAVGWARVLSPQPTARAMHGACKMDARQQRPGLTGTAGRSLGNREKGEDEVNAGDKKRSDFPGNVTLGPCAPVRLRLRSGGGGELDGSSAASESDRAILERRRRMRGFWKQ